ncbi:fasciclin domain-containing protein [Chitinophaga eiseniae]|uniref:FAS1 domain-containing protein n=1 Tax=Chitinophaga eiseniae TaxID=634771 RepID=A0A847SWG6_9BACT|nr:fasciclin domain-containing protein [Chitinophaga eiseniae]NLR81412.1 hypothetical protein [Chitinophaga eiseniae]
MKLPIYLLLLLLLGVSACRKQDLEPEPIGEPVAPPPGPDKTWQQLLETSPYSYFREAWKHSGMDAMLKQNGSAYFTLLVPEDKAFETAGWTLDKIKHADAATLNDLLSLYVLPTHLSPADLSAATVSTAAPTLSSRPLDIPEWYANYLDFQFLAKHGDSLMVNGIGQSKLTQALAGTNGVIYPMAHCISKPQQTMWDYLRQEPRFSLYVAALRISDSLYQSAGIYISPMPLLKSSSSYIQFTLYAPSNDAFIKNGFSNEDDILNYCLRSWPLPDPQYDENMFYQQPVTAMDTILNAHGGGLANAGQLANTPGGYGPRVGPVFFANDLTDYAAQLSGLKVQEGQMYQGPPVIINLSFINNNGQPGIRRLGTNHPYTAIKQANIRVINGVIHEVSDLFIP